MRETHLSALRGAVRDAIAHALEHNGWARPRDVARLVCLSHPTEIAAVGARLAEDALTEVARRELKRQHHDHRASWQLPLPLIPDPLRRRLPPTISVPGPQVDVHGALEEDEVLYKPLSQATVADLKAHLQLLQAQIQADVGRFEALRELHDLVVALGVRDDVRLADALATIPGNDPSGATRTRLGSAAMEVTP